MQGQTRYFSILIRLLPCAATLVFLHSPQRIQLNLLVIFLVCSYFLYKFYSRCCYFPDKVLLFSGLREYMKFNGPDVMGLLSIRQLTSLGITNLILKNKVWASLPPHGMLLYIVYSTVFIVNFHILKIHIRWQKKLFIKIYTVLRISSKMWAQTLQRQFRLYIPFLGIARAQP